MRVMRYRWFFNLLLLLALLVGLGATLVRSVARRSETTSAFL